MGVDDAVDDDRLCEKREVLEGDLGPFFCRGVDVEFEVDVEVEAVEVEVEKEEFRGEEEVVGEGGPGLLWRARLDADEDSVRPW